MANGFAALGDALAGPDPLAYSKGQQMGAQTQYLQAQTQDAIGKADERVRQAKAFEALGPAIQKITAANPALGDVLTQAITAGANPEQILNSIKTNQGIEANNVIMNPATDVNTRQRALAIQAPGSFAQPFDKVGGGYASKLDPNSGIIPLPAGAQGNENRSGQIQLLDAFNQLDPNGHVINPNQALSTLRDTTKVITVGGVDYVISVNPYTGQQEYVRAPAQGGPAPAAAPGLGDAAGANVQPQVVPQTPAPAAAPTAAPSPAGNPQLAFNNAAGLAGAKWTGEARAQALQALPKTVASAQDATQSIDAFLNSPGFNTIYGARVGTDWGTALTTFLSQNAADANAQRSSLLGSTFLQAAQGLKGFGQLSNMEGTKLEQAYTAATNPKIAPDKARELWGIVKQRYARLVQIANYEAGQGPIPSFVQNGVASELAPAAAPAAPAAGGGVPVGTSKTINGVTYDKTPQGWVPRAGGV